MRKKIAGILLLIMCVCCGCGKTQNRDVPKESISQEVVKEEEDIVFVPGKVENGSYENASIHLAFDVTEEMYILSEEQIEKVYALGDREMNGEGETKATIPEGVVYDIFVYLPDMLSNVMVQVEDISVTFPGEEVTVKDYADRTIAELLQVAPTYSVSDVTTKKVGNFFKTFL